MITIGLPQTESTSIRLTLLYDVVCGLGRSARLGLMVVFLDVALVSGLQSDDGMEDAASQTLSDQGRGEVFDGIQP